MGNGNIAKRAKNHNRLRTVGSCIRILERNVVVGTIANDERGYIPNWVGSLFGVLFITQGPVLSLSQKRKQNTLHPRHPPRKEALMTTKIYFTIAGMNFRYGTAVAERGMTVTLQKDPTNEYDHEAIKVNLPGLGQVGWVANSVGTVLGESYSAGRLYDKIGDTAEGTIEYVTSRGVVCALTLSADPDSAAEI